MGLRPALFSAYQDLSKLRYDLPLVLVNGEDKETVMRSLSDLIDDVLQEIAPRGIEGERIRKHVLGLEHAATENAAAAEDLLTGLVERGVSPEKRRLFALDGSKALRLVVRRVFGEVPVQRCRAHKLRNVLDRLPKDECDQAKAAIRAAWRLDAKDGQARLEKLTQWYEGDWPGAAGSGTLRNREWTRISANRKRLIGVYSR